MKARAVLCGPFMGEMCWEFYRFAPYAIHLKKTNPGSRLIVLTRSSRFDFYGQYADIFVPLRVKNDVNMERRNFKLMGYPEESYYTIVKYFREKFKKRYNIFKHIYPDIRLWRYKVKWQFPRDKMDYDFIPREKNIEIARRSMGKHEAIVDSLSTDKRIIRDDIIETTDLFARITNIAGKKSSTVGSLMECIKNAKYVIGDIRFDVSHLAVLLGTPLIHVGSPVKEDYIKLLNPLNTPVIISENVVEGVNIYEDNF